MVELFFNEKKTKIIEDTSKPIQFLGFEIMESKTSKFRKLQRQKSRLIIRPDKKKILEGLLEKNIIMHRGGIIPYAVKDSKKYVRNVKKKKETTISL